MPLSRLLRRPLFTGFSPNITFEQVITASSFLLLPWRWLTYNKGTYVQEVEGWFQGYFKGFDAVTFDSGRSALFYALKALGVGVGDEVLVQAYTCVVVVNAIRWTGARPVYVDIDQKFNMDSEDLQKKITSASKVLIIQHTFGQPAQLADLMEMAKTFQLKTIEDCAHALGAEYSGKKLGTYGDIGMFSFGSDKIVSCARGGMAITKDKTLSVKLREMQKTLPRPQRGIVIKHLLHFPFFWFGRITYTWGVGRVILGLAKRFMIINRVIWPDEKAGRQVPFFPSSLPNPLAKILLSQLRDLEKSNAHRRRIAQMYNISIQHPAVIKPLADSDQGCVYLRFPILVNDPSRLYEYAQKEGVFLGDWYNTPIAPKDIDLGATGYDPGVCPNAEALAKHSLNLPTNRHLRQKDVQRVVHLIEACV